MMIPPRAESIGYQKVLPIRKTRQGFWPMLVQCLGGMARAHKGWGAYRHAPIV
ncbi:unnamed protein product [Ectocarpus sp. CCAP 1310/34]|nr:unnamed protein product [Ectocarpus sp. CCAP 1310/34]